MASIAKDPGGKKRILFVNPDGKRKTIRARQDAFGRCQNDKKPYRKPAGFQDKRVEPWTMKRAAWVRDIPDGMADKLAAAGLIAKRENITVDGLVVAFMKAGTHFKSSTRSIWGQATGDLQKHFGKDCQIRTIDRGRGRRLSAMAVEYKETIGGHNCQTAPTNAANVYPRGTIWLA